MTISAAAHTLNINMLCVKVRLKQIKSINEHQTFFKNVLSTFYLKCAWEVLTFIGSLHIWIKRCVINGFQCLQKILINIYIIRDYNFYCLGLVNLSQMPSKGFLLKLKVQRFCLHFKETHKHTPVWSEAGTGLYFELVLVFNCIQCKVATSPIRTI